MESHRLNRYLLDANLSPKTARYLSRELGLNVVSLLTRGLGELLDRDVLSFALREDRILITQDRDFLSLRSQHQSASPGIIYLVLQKENRRIASVNTILSRFFAEHGSTIDLPNSLVIISETEIRVISHSASG